VFSKLYSLVCVYVHFRIQSTTNEAFIIDSEDNFGKLAFINMTICSICTNAMAHYQSVNGLSLKSISESSS